MLEALLDRFARQTSARWWIGNRPDVPEGQLLLSIAAQVGLPTSTEATIDDDDFISVNRAEAAHALAVAGTTSLAYGQPVPRSDALLDAERALAQLGEHAKFFSNARWHEPSSIGWMPLTTATFECGVIGYDDRHAFIFWVEEED